jgi:hypothetical protein
MILKLAMVVKEGMKVLSKFRLALRSVYGKKLDMV